MASASILAIVLCGWLLYRYLPRELYLHLWTGVYPLNRVAFWGVLNCRISGDDGLGDSTLRTGPTHPLRRAKLLTPLKSHTARRTRRFFSAGQNNVRISTGIVLPF